MEAVIYATCGTGTLRTLPMLTMVGANMRAVRRVLIPTNRSYG
jgi:hypothetical protein